MSSFKFRVLKLSNEAKIGALTIIAVALLVIGFNLLKGKNLLTRRKTLYAFYDNVNGLMPANPVRVNGLQIGSVSDLSVTDQNASRIRVKLSIDPGINIPQNSVASIVSSDVLGAKSVVINFGNAGVYLQNDDTIQTGPGTSLTSDLMNNLKPLSGKIQSAVVALDTVLSDIHSSLDNKTRDNLKSSIAELNTTMKNFSQVSDSIKTITGNINAITVNLRNNNDTINSILSNTRQITASIASADLKATIDDLHKTIKRLNNIMAKIDSGEGSLGMLVNDKKFYENIRAVSYNLNLLMEDLRLNPQRYVHFSLFGKKNKVQPLPGGQAGLSGDTLK